MALNPYEREHRIVGWVERQGGTVSELVALFIASLLVGCLFLLGLNGCGPGTPQPTPTPGPTPPPPVPGWDCTNPPTLRGVVQVKGGIAGQYTVRLRTRAHRMSAAQVEGVAARHAGVKVKRVHRKGFAAEMTAAAAQRVADDPEVQFVHETVPVKASVTWGLDCADEPDECRHLSGTYEPGATGAGVNVAVIDTGVYLHPDFQGRIAGDCFDAYGGSCDDDNGHGTHVMSTVLSSTWGIAKQATGYRVRVLRNGTGTDSDVIRGIEWVTDRKLANPSQDWAANMSLGGSASPALDAATCDSIEAGVVYAVAAGNDYGADACTQSPARVAQALTVGAMNRQDAAAAFSNLGRCVDLFGPGQDIEGAWRGGGSNTISGTSMASPHVAGGAALYLGRNPGALPDEVHAGLRRAAIPGTLSGVSESPNLRLFVR
jgi:subtilisin family serine protease